MKLALVNAVPSEISPSDCILLAMGLSFWLVDVCARLELSPTSLAFYHELGAVPPDAAVFTLAGDPPASASGDLGYHSELPSGQLSAPIFTHPILKSSSLCGDPWSVSAVLGHEIVELLKNPHVNLYVLRQDGLEQSFEFVDPVQGVCTFTDVGSSKVACPNYVLPSYFDPLGSPPFDAMGKLSGPFTRLDAGYRIEYDPKTGQTRFDFGAAMPPEVAARVLAHGRHARASRRAAANR